MTVKEAANQYGTKEYRTSMGDNLIIIMRKLYDSDDDVYQQVLQELNHRSDWYALRPNEIINYIPPYGVDTIDQL